MLPFLKVANLLDMSNAMINPIKESSDVWMTEHGSHNPNRTAHEQREINHLTCFFGHSFENEQV